MVSFEMGMNEVIDEATGEVLPAVREPEMQVMVSANPVDNFRQMRALVTEVADACKGKAFRANIKGRDYPTVQWWTTVGASLGMFPYEVWSKKIQDDDGNMAYESFVEVRRNGVAITSASAICSTGESTWSNRDEYAVKSMATTRATAKAYRLGLSFLAVLAGLEATPAEEMPRDGGSFPRRATAPKPKVSEARRSAQQALVDRFGTGNAAGEAKVAFIKETLGVETITSPDELSDDEWRFVEERLIGEPSDAADPEEGDR